MQQLTHLQEKCQRLHHKNNSYRFCRHIQVSFRLPAASKAIMDLLKQALPEVMPLLTTGSASQFNIALLYCANSQRTATLLSYIASVKYKELLEYDNKLQKKEVL